MHPRYQFRCLIIIKKAFFLLSAFDSLALTEFDYFIWTELGDTRFTYKQLTFWFQLMSLTYRLFIIYVLKKIAKCGIKECEWGSWFWKCGIKECEFGLNSHSLIPHCFLSHFFLSHTFLPLRYSNLAKWLQFTFWYISVFY